MLTYLTLIVGVDGSRYFLGGLPDLIENNENSNVSTGNRNMVLFIRHAIRIYAGR